MHHTVALTPRTHTRLGLAGRPNRKPQAHSHFLDLLSSRLTLCICRAVWPHEHTRRFLSLATQYADLEPHWILFLSKPSPVPVSNCHVNLLTPRSPPSTATWAACADLGHASKSNSAWCDETRLWRRSDGETRIYSTSESFQGPDGSEDGIRSTIPS